MMLAAASPVARETNQDFWLVGGVCIALLAGVTIAMIAFAVRYRRSRSPITRQIHGHFALEIAWIVFPTLIVMWMFLVGLRGFNLARTTPADAMTVQVTGRQWAWSFNYPDDGIDAPELVVPVGRAVRLQINSADVVHSLYIPAFRVKEDAVPGQTTHMWIQADQPGTYNIFCAELCGKDHSQMITLLRALPPEAYERWIGDQVAKRFRPLTFAAISNPQLPAFGPGDLNIDRDRLYQTFCASCHGAAGDGSGLPGVARDFRNVENWKRSPKAADIFRTLTEGVANTQMRPFPNLSPWEKIALAHRVRSFVTSPPPDTVADFDSLVTQYGLKDLKPPPRHLPIQRAIELLVHQASTRPATQPDAPEE